MARTTEKPPGIGLAEAIGVVREELARAAEDGAGSDLAFRPESVELEFEVMFERVTKGDAGLRVWVVSVGGGGEKSRADTQRLKVTFSPVDRVTGRPIAVGE